MPRNDFRFKGFASPNYTTVPDELFDVLMPHLTDPELRVLLYIVRRTFGFKKASDDISLKQMVGGITAKDGRVLDGGAGLSKASAARGLKGLADKGIITATRNSSLERGNEPTTYRLCLFEDSLSQTETRLVSVLTLGLVSNRDTQETELQETELQETELDISIGPQRTFGDDDRKTIQPFIADLARELNDQAKLAASTTRAVKLYQASKLDLESFLDAMQEARRRTQEHSASIRNTDTEGVFPRKRKFAYFLSVLENLISDSNNDISSVAD
jgi:hypothetical protein